MRMGEPRGETVAPREGRRGLDYKLVLHIFQPRKSRLAGERNIPSSPSTPSPYPFHSFEISFRVKVFPLLSLGTLK